MMIMCMVPTRGSPGEYGGVVAIVTKVLCIFPPPPRLLLLVCTIKGMNEE